MEKTENVATSPMQRGVILPAPIYKDSFLEIYKGDCREILAALSGKLAIVSDPPYGIPINTNFNMGKKGKRAADGKRFDEVFGNDEPFDPGHLMNFDHVLLWGANHFCQKLPHNGRWLVWDKRCGVQPVRTQADCEMAWVNTYGAARVFRHIWDGMIKDSERGESRVHPTQKPVQLMQWCLEFIPDDYTIVDPYMGSGTTLKACKELRRRCIGIEISEEYCQAAIKRLGQETLPF